MKPHGKTLAQIADEAGLSRQALNAKRLRLERRLRRRLGRQRQQTVVESVTRTITRLTFSAAEERLLLEPLPPGRPKKGASTQT